MKLLLYLLLIIGLVYITIAVYQTKLLQYFVSRKVMRGLEIYQFLIPFKRSNQILNHFEVKPDEKAKLKKVLQLRKVNSILFFIAFLIWLYFMIKVLGWI